MSDQPTSSLPVLIDIGNTAIKALIDNQVCYLDAEQLPNIGWAVVANVRTERLAELPENWQQVAVCKSFAGFEVAYQEPSQLGVDRWLSMLAVRERLCGDEVAIVVDVGTAIKIEVFSHGYQLGGYILPGFSHAHAALFGAADRLHGAEFDQSLEPAIATQTSIGRAMPAAVVALLEKLIGQYDARVVVISGGDAQAILPFIEQAEYQSNLVLEGLAYWWMKK